MLPTHLHTNLLTGASLLLCYVTVHGIRCWLYIHTLVQTILVINRSQISKKMFTTQRFFWSTVCYPFYHETLFSIVSMSFPLTRTSPSLPFPNTCSHLPHVANQYVEGQPLLKELICSSFWIHNKLSTSKWISNQLADCTANRCLICQASLSVRRIIKV